MLNFFVDEIDDKKELLNVYVILCLQSWAKITGHLLIFPSFPLSPKINVVIAEKFHDR